VVLTNPPFGGEEERSVQTNFPAATRTSDTALLFLQSIERMLAPGGRCGMVVPNNILNQTGVAGEVKRRLFESCDVHTIVRLPPGVFAPSTDIPTNLLFFDKTGPTRETWFYDVRLPEGRRQYTKTSRSAATLLMTVVNGGAVPRAPIGNRLRPSPGKWVMTRSSDARSTLTYGPQFCHRT